MASTCVSHDALTGYTPAHDLAFLESQERAPAIRGLLYKEGQRPQRDNAHVRWDEQCIAEHDKERGTRQKIDEPDTPFVRSPQTSDSEEEASAKSAPSACKPKRHELDVEDETRTATSPKSMAMLTNRLNQWVESGDQRRDSRGSNASDEASREAEAEACRPETKSVPSKIRLPEDEGHHKASSSEFKERRAKHYNEFAAIKALQKKRTDSESSADSDTSDEAAAAAKRERKAKKQVRPCAAGEQGRTGGISSSAGLPSGVSQETSGMPGEECEASSQQPVRTLPNPMEGGRPPVQFGEDAPAEGTSLPSSEFLAQRRAHYDEGTALRSRLEDSPLHEGSPEHDRFMKPVANPMDPTEPQEAAVSFKVESLAGGHQGGGGDDTWRSKRNAHYRDMAAAFRSLPPVSDSDSDGDSP